MEKPRSLLRRFVLTTGAIALVSAGMVYFGNDLLRLFESREPSQSHGSTSDGWLENGKRLPSGGPNFRAYGRLPALLGRNSVHEKVRDVVVASYKSLEEKSPGVTYIYGEASWPWGGRLYPHKTHQNGLSVDFMVPVKKGERSTKIPTHLLNRYGYDVDFDRSGQSEADGSEIDFEAMAKHLHALKDAADAEGLRIWRVIFAPDLQPELFATPSGKRLRGRMTFLQKPSWVRHDDHYHVDFRDPD